MKQESCHREGSKQVRRHSKKKLHARTTITRQRDEDEWLASEGCSPLRSEQPSEASKQPPTQEAL
jgi:hypothetical protein